MSQQASLTLELSVDETNQILEALGEQPYAKVFQLIQKIHQQAQSQLHEATTQPDRNGTA